MSTLTPNAVRNIQGRLTSLINTHMRGKARDLALEYLSTLSDGATLLAAPDYRPELAASVSEQAIVQTRRNRQAIELLTAMIAGMGLITDVQAAQIRATTGPSLAEVKATVDKAKG